jgi:DNA invertase Pin-like site-specific DNA recombinase
MATALSTPSSVKRAYSYIRFSTPDQAHGDSLRRQLKVTEDYVVEKGLTLDRELTFRDLGVSAYRGTNKTEGALAAFIGACKKGRVTPGSVLLVESLDRLSRETVRKAMRQLLELIDDYGIEIHTLKDNKVYGSGTDFQDLLFSLVIMSRSNEESKTKSERVGAAWREKKSEARKELRTTITSRVPYWIKGRMIGKFKGAPLELIPDRARVVRKIFDLALSGFGTVRIAEELNRTEEPFGAKGWYKSYIEKILKNPVTYGLYQPFARSADGTREPEGEPIEGFFPPVIDEGVFAEVQRRRAAKSTLGGIGRRKTIVGPDTARNLFAGLLRDEELKVSMIYDRRAADRTAEIITSSARYDKNGCSAPHRLPYSVFEKAFLDLLDRTDWKTLVDSPVKTEAEEELERVKSDRATAERKLAEFDAVLDKEAPTRLLIDKIRKTEAALEAALAREAELERVVSATRTLMIKPEALKASIASGDVPARFRIREEIRKRVTRIALRFPDPYVVAEIHFINNARRWMTFVREPDGGLRVQELTVWKAADGRARIVKRLPRSARK